LIVDSSVIVEVEVDAPHRAALVQSLLNAPALSIGAPTVVELGMVLVGRFGPYGRTLLRRTLDEFGLEVIPFENEHWPVALAAFEVYGKGRHPARLNFGHCLTYATAKVAGEPLLCLGDDFAQTDLELATI
jgi:ribonuclease VapC